MAIITGLDKGALLDLIERLIEHGYTFTCARAADGRWQVEVHS